MLLADCEWVRASLCIIGVLGYSFSIPAQGASSNTAAGGLSGGACSCCAVLCCARIMESRVARGVLLCVQWFCWQVIGELAWVQGGELCSLFPVLKELQIA